MASNNKQSVAGVARLLFICAIVLLICLFAYWDFSAYRVRRQWSERRAWVNQRTQEARVSFDTLVQLAQYGHDDSSSYEDWKRDVARGVVCRLVRLPDEVAQKEYGDYGQRWENVFTALVANSLPATYDGQHQLWLLRAKE